MADFAYSDPARARRNVIRGAILWTPFFVLFAALAVSSLVRALDESGTAWVTFALTGLLALVTGDSAFAALRDLFAEPIETEGEISRKWIRSDLFIMRGRYVLVGTRAFRLRKTIFQTMPEVGRRVRCLHYPHSNALMSWSAVEEPPAAFRPQFEQSAFPARPVGQAQVEPPPLDRPAGPEHPKGTSAVAGDAPTEAPPFESAEESKPPPWGSGGIGGSP